MVNIITKEDHKYRHFNRSMGKFIEGKAHYEHEMKKGGYVSYEEGQKLAEEGRKNNRKEYKISQTAREIIAHAKLQANSKGKVKLSDKAIDAIKSLGMRFDREIPKQEKIQGGFYGSRDESR